MSELEDFAFASTDFPETVRLFPLPNLVLFPHVVQPLHIFEPRYREMLAESLQDDRLIAMATLAPGWEKDYEKNPPISPYACLGRVMVHQALDDGTSNILLAGVARIELVREIPSGKGFRKAQAVLHEDHGPDPGDPRGPGLFGQLREAVERTVSFMPDVRQQLEELAEREIPLGTLTDLIAYLLDLDLSEKLILLGEPKVASRAEILVRKLEALRADRQLARRGETPFPPPVSRN